MADVQFTDALTEVRPFASKSEAEAGTNTTKVMSPKRVAEAIAALSQLNLSGADVVTLLEALDGLDRLNKSAILGGDSAMNYKDTTDMSQYSTLTSTYPNVIKGDLWIHDGDSFDSGDDVNNGDWIMALNDDAAFEAAYQTSEWLVIPRGAFTSIGEIVTALEALTTTNRLNKSAIKGGDYSLNYRGTGDVYLGSYQATDMLAVMKGDMWIMTKSTGSPTESDTSKLTNYDQVIAVQDGVTSFVFSNTANWLIIRKKMHPRVLSFATSSAPAIDTDLYDAVSITALAETITSMTSNLSGSPSNFDRLIIRIISSSSSERTITWGTSFVNKGGTLPASVENKLVTVTLEYDTQTSKWGCIHVATEA